MKPSPSLRPRTWPEAFAALFNSTGLFLVLIFSFIFIWDQILTELIQNEIMNPNGASNWIWIYGGISLASGLIGPVLVSFLAICAWRHPDAPLLSVAKRSFSYLVREEMRVLGQTLLWGIAFIIPGILRFLQCLFVPFVVVLDPHYQAGEVDALEASRRRFGQVWARVLGLFFLFVFVLPILMTSFDEARSFLRQPFTAVPLMFVELTFMLLFQWLLLKSWEKTHAPVLSKV